MNQKPQDLEQSLARAVTEITPDVWPDVLLRLEQNSGVQVDADSAPQPEADASQALPAPTPLPQTKRKGRSLATAVKWASSLAAMLVLAFGIYFGVGYFTPQATISFDVNPSIELKVNRSEKVLSANPLNADAVIILADMDLKNTNLDVAVNAIIGSMVKNGYLNELHNSILISVESTNNHKGQQLQKRLTQDVNSLLESYALEGAVLSQTVSEDERLQALATEYDISLSKAALIDVLVSQDTTLTFAEIAPLPINDINLLISSRNTELTGVEAQGQASSSAYIGEERAKVIAFSHAGVAEASATKLEIKLDYEDGRLVYEVEFNTADGEYEYEIDAVDGAIVQYDHELHRTAGTSNNTGQQQTAPTPENTSNGGSRYLATSEATTIALNHAGLAESEAEVVKHTRYEKQGRMRYDIEFLSATAKYSYEIDAQTGEIIANHQKDLAQPSPSGGDNDHAGQDNSQYIGEAQAKTIALNHAGATADSVRDFDCKLDKEDGLMVYEIDFDFNGQEYEYEINAVSGKIIYWEAERD